MAQQDEATRPADTETDPDATELISPAEAARETEDVIDEVYARGVGGDAAKSNDALAWFMASEEEQAGEAPNYTLEINVSTDVDHDNFIPWVIKPIASTRIDELRRQYSAVPRGNRAQRRQRGVEVQVDIARFNAALVFEATVAPDLASAARSKGVANGGDIVLHRFRYKPLLVDQIAGKVLQFSGADEDDMREAREVIAAKNS